MTGTSRRHFPSSRVAVGEEVAAAEARFAVEKAQLKEAHRVETLSLAKMHAEALATAKAEKALAVSRASEEAREAAAKMVEETSAAARQAAVEKAAAERSAAAGAKESRQFREAMETSETARQSLLRELAARDAKIAALDAEVEALETKLADAVAEGERCSREATEAKSALNAATAAKAEATREIRRRSVDRGVLRARDANAPSAEEVAAVAACKLPFRASDGSVVFVI